MTLKLMNNILVFFTDHDYGIDHPRPVFFPFFIVLSFNNDAENGFDDGKIWTWDVGLEGMFADHYTTTTALS